MVSGETEGQPEACQLQTRYDFGLKYRRLAVNNEPEKANALLFLEMVNGLQYVPDDLRAVQISDAVARLARIHRGWDNFSNEVAPARELRKLVGDKSLVPKQARQKYVLGLVDVFLTNGSGVSWTGDGIYLDLLGRLDSTQALIAVASFAYSPTIRSKLQFGLCRQKYMELFKVLAPKMVSPAAQAFFAAVRDFSGPPIMMTEDVTIQRHITAVDAILRSAP